MVGIQRRRAELRALENHRRAATTGPSSTVRDGRKPKDGIYGRIAISIFRAKPTTIYAQVEAGASAGTGGGTTAEGGPHARRTRRQLSGGGGSRTGGGGNAPPPNPNGSGVFRSDDGGKTWTFESNQDQRPTYFSQIRVDPVNDQKLFVGGNPGQMSLDGGKTWQADSPARTPIITPSGSIPKIRGSSRSATTAASISATTADSRWDYHNDIAVGQFYQVSADMRRPYYVCGGLQDNNAWCGPSAVRSNNGPVNTDWFTVAGGDGFYTRQDPTDWAIVYGESQDGNMSRHDLRTGIQKSIRPTVGRAGTGRRATANEISARDNHAGRHTPQAAGNRGGRSRRTRRRGTRRAAQRDQRAAQCRAVPLLLERAVRDFAAQSGKCSTWRRSISSSPPIAATRGG